MKIQVAGYLSESRINGEGTRSVIFVSGCRHNCQGCHNKEMQNYNYGDNVEISDVYERIKEDSFIDGVTYSGGEPFDKVEELCILSDFIISDKLTIWTYTGYLFEDLLSSDEKRKLLEKIDILVDGRFDENLTDGNLLYRGSRNQRIIDVKESLKQNKIILYKGGNYDE